MSKKILIVDDEKDILELLDYHLIKEGYETMKASNGKEALLIAKDFLPDLVLLDLMLLDLLVFFHTTFSLLFFVVLCVLLLYVIIFCCHTRVFFKHANFSCF